MGSKGSNLGSLIKFILNLNTFIDTVGLNLVQINIISFFKTIKILDGEIHGLKTVQMKKMWFIVDINSSVWVNGLTGQM